MTFEEYCLIKKIDGSLFKQAEPDKYDALKLVFEQMSSNSFTQQKLFLINDIRRKFRLAKEATVPKEELVKPSAAPAKNFFKPKI